MKKRPKFLDLYASIYGSYNLYQQKKLSEKLTDRPAQAR